VNHVNLLMVIPNGLSDVSTNHPSLSQRTEVCAKVAWLPAVGVGEKHQGPHRKKIRPTKRVSFVGLFCLVRICEDASVAKVRTLFSKDLLRICEDAKSLFFGSP